MVHKLCHVLRNDDSDSPTRNFTFHGVNMQCKGQPLDLDCSWAAHLGRQKCVRGPCWPCVKPSCVTRGVKFHLGEACPSSKLSQRLFICAVKKWPSCFPVKLSAYCCKSFELYFCGQALAIFLPPVAFFPSLDPECSELGAAGLGDRERAGPWHGDRGDIGDVGSSKICCGVILQAAGQGLGFGEEVCKAQRELGDGVHDFCTIWAHVCSRVNSEHIC